jgi:hypothetical protein
VHVKDLLRLAFGKAEPDVGAIAVTSRWCSTSTAPLSG